MVVRGWGHGALMAMAEDEFAFWLAWQHEYDRLVDEAIERRARGR